MILQDAKSLFSWLKEKVKAAWSWLKKQSPVLKQTPRTVSSFLVSPMSQEEYALLKRISAIVGTAVAVYLVFVAGTTTVFVVIGLCFLFSFMLHKITSTDLGALPIAE